MIDCQVESVAPPVTSNMLRCNRKPVVADCDCVRIVLNAVRYDEEAQVRLPAVSGRRPPK